MSPARVLSVTTPMSSMSPVYIVPFAVDSVYRQAVHAVHATERQQVVDLAVCKSALENFVLHHSDIVKMTERRLQTFEPVVTVGSENHLQKLMTAVVACQKWKAVLHRSQRSVDDLKSQRVKDQLEQTKLKFMCYHMLLLDSFAIVGDSKV